MLIHLAHLNEFNFIYLSIFGCLYLLIRRKNRLFSKSSRGCSFGNPQPGVKFIFVLPQRQQQQIRYPTIYILHLLYYSCSLLFVSCPLQSITICYIQPEWMYIYSFSFLSNVPLFCHHWRASSYLSTPLSCWLLFLQLQEPLSLVIIFLCTLTR